MRCSKGLNKTIGNFSFNPNVLLGQGYSAKVYLGYEHITGRPVAVKVIEQNLINSSVLATLLDNEVKCHKLLNHENILKIYDQLSSANRVYMVSEYCESGTLFDFIVKHGALNEELALRFLLQILKAVSYIHSIGIIHRDIKSANILIQNGQVLKLADFGFAMFTSHTPTHCEYNVGSPVYMSPEAFTFNQYSVKSDVWSVGMIFYEMLIGQQPFYAYNWSDIIALITSGKIYESLQHVSSFSKQLFARMMEFDPRNRATTEELIKKVHQRLSGQHLRMGSRSSAVVRMTYRSIILK